MRIASFVQLVADRFMLSGVTPTGRHVNIAVTEAGRLLWGELSSEQPIGGPQQSGTPTVAIYPSIEILYIDNVAQEKSISFQKARLIEFYCRNNVAIRYAFEPNKAGLKNEPYIILPAGVSQPITLPANTFWSGSIFFAADTTATIQIEVWKEVS